MRIGGSVASTHAHGMSALWHDTALDDDGLPLRRLHVPTVEKQIEDMPLPAEEHKLPEGYADPFSRMEAAYDVAAAQMDRGLKGAEFLHGKAPKVAEAPDTAEVTLRNEGAAKRARSDERAAQVDAQVDPHDATRTMMVQAGDRSYAMDARVKEQQRVEAETVRHVSKATVQTGHLPDAVQTAARREAERAAEQLHMAESLGIPAAMAPIAASQVAQAATLPSVVANAVTVAGAAASAGEVAAVGIAQGMNEEPAIVRRALRRPAPKPVFDDGGGES